MARGLPVNYPEKIYWDGSEIESQTLTAVETLQKMGQLSQSKMDALTHVLTAQAASQYGPAGAGGVAGTYASSTPRGLANCGSGQLLNMIQSRFHLAQGESLPFQSIHCHAISNDKVFVFVVHNDQAVVIEENNLFPSDTLMGQLKLILG